MIIQWNCWVAMLVDLPAILDSLFHGLVTTTSASIGVEGGGDGEPGSGGFLQIIIWHCQMASTNYIKLPEFWLSQNFAK